MIILLTFLRLNLPFKTIYLLKPPPHRKLHTLSFTALHWLKKNNSAPRSLASLLILCAIALTAFIKVGDGASHHPNLFWIYLMHSSTSKTLKTKKNKTIYCVLLHSSRLVGFSTASFVDNKLWCPSSQFRVKAVLCSVKVPSYCDNVRGILFSDSQAGGAAQDRLVVAVCWFWRDQKEEADWAPNAFIGIWHEGRAKFSIWNLGSPTMNSCHGALVWAEGTLIGYEPLIRLGGQAFVLLHVSLLEEE